MPTSAYKLQRSTVGCNAALLICARSKKKFSISISIWHVKFCSSKTPKNISERKILLEKEENYLAHLLAKTTQINSHLNSFVFSQLDLSEEFLDATKFYGSKNPKNLKRIILKIKRAVSEREIFLEKEGENTLQLKLN